MNQKEEKWAVFWCDLLAPVIYEEIEAEATHSFLRQLSSEKVMFPDGSYKAPSLSTLKRTETEGSMRFSENPGRIMENRGLYMKR